MRKDDPLGRKEKARQRAAAIRDWIKNHRSKRMALTKEDATLIGDRIETRLHTLKKNKGVSRGKVADKAFGGNARTDKAWALNKLRWYTAGSDRSRGCQSRTPGPYFDLIEAIASYLDCEVDDLLIEVFDGTQADPHATGRSWLDTESARHFDRMLRELAARLSGELDLQGYALDLARCGAIRDLRVPDVAFMRDWGGDLASPSGDFNSALLPIIDAMDENEVREGEYLIICLGRLPAVPLYRMRVSEPVAVDLRLKSRHSNGHAKISAIECRRGRVIYYLELRIGVGPRNNRGGSGMFFEWVPLALVKLNDSPSMKSNASDDTVLWPENAYRLPGSVWPDKELIFHAGDRILCGDVLDPATNRRFTDEGLSDHANIPDGFQVDAVHYFAATPATCWRYLAEWPDKYWDRIEYLDLHPSDGKTPVGGFFSPNTPGEVLERQLRSNDRSPESIEGQLLAAGETLREALVTLRKERLSACQVEATNSQTVPSDEVEKCLAMSPKEWRKTLDLKQAEAAWLLGVTPRTLRHYEQDALSMPHAVRLAMLLCQRDLRLARELAVSHEKTVSCREQSQ